MHSPPWSQTQLKRLGRFIRDGSAPPLSLPAYGDVIVWYNDLAAEVQRAIASHDWSPVLGERPFEITSRAKTVDTLRQKLQRDHSTPLSSIQDVAGVRFEAEMSLDEQDEVARQIADLFGHAGSDCIHDLRAKPHSGYRAVHVWLRLEARVEVQVRTHLQGDWANAYEAAADFLGRGIRYGEMPKSAEYRTVVEAMQNASTGPIAELERARNTANRIRGEYAERLRDLAHYKDDDTLPHALVNAQEADARMGELMEISVKQELELRNALVTVKTMFDSISKGGS